MKALIKEKLIGVMLYAQDLRRAGSWYCENLGFVLADHHFDHFIELALDGRYVLHLFKDPDLSPVAKPVFSFDTEDIDEAYRLLTCKEVKVYPIITFGDHRSFSFKDSEGNMLMISKYE